MLTEDRLATAEPDALPVAGPAPVRRAPRLTWAGVGALLLAVGSGVAALAIAHGVFPDMSDNNDEGVYRLQADAMRHGHLFPPAPPEVEASRPWLNVISGDHYVPKYTPVYAAVIAAARIVTGSDHGALFIVAFAAVLSAYWLAREILQSRGQALIAAGFLAASPAILIQSGLFLSYLFVVALMQGAVAAFIRGVRDGSPRFLQLAGLLAGFGLFARPYDAVLFGVPLVAWWGLSRRRDWPRAKRELKSVAFGAALPVTLMFAYFWAASGSPLRSPFTLLHPDDRFGFGRRQMYEGDVITRFTPWRGLVGSARHVELVSFWSFGGYILIGLALAGLRRLRGAGLGVAAVAVTVPVGYMFFWGIWGSTEWGGPRRLGPFYTISMITALAIVGARGLVRMWKWDWFLAGAAVVGMALVSFLVVKMAVDENLPFSEERARLYEPLRELPEGKSVIFLPPVQGQWLGHPFALARNGSLDGPVVWAVDRGAEENRRFLRAFPDRAAYRLRADRIEGKVSQGLPNLDFTTRLEPFPRARRQFAPP
jgi:hypothetical protein